MAREHYQRAQEAMKALDWALYGEEIKALGEVLERLAAQPDVAPARPEAVPPRPAAPKEPR